MFAQQSHALEDMPLYVKPYLLDRHHLGRARRGSTSLWVIVNLAKSASSIFLNAGRNITTSAFAQIKPLPLSRAK